MISFRNIQILLRPTFRDFFPKLSFQATKNLIMNGNDDDSSLEELLSVLETTLPNVVSNVILTKRDELIPLLLVTINNHYDHNVRDKMLNILFNLIKAS